MRERANALLAPYTLLGLVLLGAVAAGAAVFLALAGEVRASGELLSGRPPVDRVELLGAITLYVDKRTSLRGLGADLATPDLLTALGFAALSAVALMAAAFREIAAGANNRLWRFWFIAAAGAGFLCVDELYTLHETFGYNADDVTALPGISHADDFFVLLFGLAGAVFCVWYRRILYEHRLPLFVLGLGGAIFAGAATLDLAVVSWEEETEALGAITVCGAFVLLALEQFARDRFAPPLELRASSNGLDDVRLNEKAVIAR